MATLQEPLLKSRLSQKFEEVKTTENIIDCISRWNPSEHSNFKGHNNEVWSCAITSDNQIIFSGSKDGNIIAWSPEGLILFTFKHHTETLGVLILTQDDTKLISADWSSNICIWDLEKMQLFKEIKGNSAKIYAAALSYCENFLATCGEGAVLDLWNVSDWTIIKSISTDSKLSLSVTFNQSSTLIAVSCSEGLIKVFNRSTFELEKKYQPDENAKNEIQSLVLACDDTLFIIGYKTSNLIKIMTVSEKKIIHTFSNFKNTVRGILISNDNKFIIAYSADQSVKIFNISARSHEYTIDGCNGFLFSGCLSKDNTVLVCTSSDGIVRKWDFGSRKRVEVIEMHKKPTFAMDVSKDNNYMATGGQDTIMLNDKKFYPIKLLNLKEEGQVFYLAEHVAAIWALRFSPDGKSLASAANDKTLTLWDVDEKKVSFKFTDESFPVYCLAFSPNSQVLIAGSLGISIFMYDTATGGKINCWKGHTNSISAIEISNDGKFIVSGSSDYSVKIWDFETGRFLKQVRSEYNEVESIAFSPSAEGVLSRNLIAFGYKNGEVEIFEWQEDSQSPSMTKLASYQKHRDRVKDIVFSSTGSFLVSGCYDGTIRVWNIDENMEDFSLAWKNVETRKLHINSTDTEIISLDKSGKVFFWNISQNRKMDLADIRNPIETYLFLGTIKKSEAINKNHIHYKFGDPRINLAHFYACLGKEKLLTAALRAGTEIKRDFDGHSPLFYALKRKLQGCVDGFLKYFHELKHSNLKLFLIYAKQIRDDFKSLIKNCSVHLPDFLDDVFYKVELENNFAFPKQALPIINYSDSSTVSTSLYFFSDSEESRAQSKVNFQVLTMPFTIPCELGSRSSLKFLENICSCSNARIMQCRVIQTYIKQKWEAVFGFIVIQTIVLALIIVLMIFLVVKTHIPYPVELYSEYLRISFITLNSLHVVHEMIQAYSSGLKYLSFWNIIDVLRLVLSLSWAVLSVYLEQSDLLLFILTFFMVCFNLTRGITCFRIFDKSRYYVRLIVSAIRDSFSFLLVFFYSTLSFGVLYLMSADSETDIWSIWTAPYELNMGITDRVNTHGKKTYIYFFLASVINVIIMLNLLISILGDTFDSFQLNASQIDYFEMAEVVHEIESLMIWKRGVGLKRFLQVCEEITGGEEENWNGKVKQIIDTVKKLKEETNAQFRDIKKNSESQFSEIKEKINSDIQELQKNIDLQYEKVNQKIDSQYKMINQKIDYLIAAKGK